jgi:anthranilate synthase component 1
MIHYPSFEEFRSLANDFDLVPIYRQLTGDTLTPVSAFCKIQEDDWSFLFESVVGGERLGRYSFLGSGPFLRLQARDRRVSIERLHSAQPPGSWKHEEITAEDPFTTLQSELGRARSPHISGLPRFCGGAVGYAGYDTVRYVERLPNPPPDDRGLPDLCFAFYDRMVIFDHLNKTIAAVAHAHVDRRQADLGYRAACARVDRLVERLQQGFADLQLTDVSASLNAGRTGNPPGCETGISERVPNKGRPVISNFTPGTFEKAVQRAQEYIRAGDIFQVVLSQRLQTETRARPFDIYRTLRIVNPSPFMFYLKAGALCLVGSSPEIMARVESCGTGRRLTIRPLAGTRPRGHTDEEDRRLAQELANDPKERAEHIMLVDLGRNDVGRVADFGSIELSDIMAVERYSHVMHLSSNVTGRLRDGVSALDALRACLPAGTLSGAPKVRAMEIIDELEPVRRGPYGGAIGYIDFSGNMDTCIGLRTLVLKGQTVYLQAGAGIVADSVPELEREETLNKAKGLLRALEMAETQL